MKVETGRRLTIEDLLAAIRAADPDAYISEQESGWFVIDGRFDLAAATQMLSETLERHPA